MDNYFDPPAAGEGAAGMEEVVEELPAATNGFAASANGVALSSSQGNLILLRHGQSIWNLDPLNPTAEWRYAGSSDIPLSARGVQEALEAADHMRHYHLDYVYTSQLIRATMTAFLALSRHADSKNVVWHRAEDSWPEIAKDDVELDHVPLRCTSILNERNFGVLEGISSKDHLSDGRTEEDLRRWRVSYRERFPGSAGESAYDVFHRVIPFFVREIVPLILRGKNVLIVSHGFVLRVLTKFLEEMSDAEFEHEMTLEKSDPEKCRLLAPTGAPIVYQIADMRSRSFKRVPRDVALEVAHSDAPAYVHTALPATTAARFYPGASSGKFSPRYGQTKSVRR